MIEEDRLVRAHDLIVAILLGEIKIDVSDEEAISLTSICNTLCWVLDHKYNDIVQRILDGLEYRMMMRGLTMEKREEDE